MAKVEIGRSFYQLGTVKVMVNELWDGTTSRRSIAERRLFFKWCSEFRYWGAEQVVVL